MPSQQLRFSSEYLKALEPSTNLHLYSIAWDEFIELQVVDKQTFIHRSTVLLESVDRWEVGFSLGSTAVGGIVLAEDCDPHVGVCLSVLAQYVIPPYRNKGVSLQCMRYALNLAKTLEYPVLAYTHRIGDWKYQTLYRRIT